MKKLLVLLMAIALSSVSYSQELGVRFGNVATNDVAVDAIVSLGDYSRVHVDASFGNGGVGLDALLDFVYKPVLGDDALYWYVGAGVSSFLGDPFFLGASGELGLQYTFNFPMSLSADWRPTFWLVKPDGADGFSADVYGINLRYVF